MNPILEARNLTKRFGDVTALQDVAFTLPPGHIVGLLGRNGSGKTTLLGHFAGMLLPSSGECLTFGIPARDLESAHLCRLGFAPQETRFIEWMTVNRHLTYIGSFYPDFDKSRADRLIKDLELSPNAVVGALSAGDRQKFSIIAAVCHHPKLLLIDEPFSALDPIVRERLLHLLLELAREDESSIVVSSHILHDVEKVIDWVVCIHQGRLVTNTPFDDLLETHAEWTVTARTRDLPAHFEEPFVTEQQGDARRARLFVRNAARFEADFCLRHDVDCTARPLNLEQIFPLLLRNGNSRP